MTKHWRHYPRVLPDPARPLVLSIDPAPSFGDFEICDISEGGLELAAAGPLDGSLMAKAFALDLWLPEPVNARLRTTGTVRHIEGDRIGVAFTDLTAEQRESLQRFVEDLQQRGRLINRLREGFKKLVE